MLWLVGPLVGPCGLVTPFSLATGAVGLTSRALAGCWPLFCRICDWFCEAEGWVICCPCAQAGTVASSAIAAVAAVKA